MATVGSGVYGVSNPNISSGTLAPGVFTYYEKVFLARAEYELILKEGGQIRTHPANNGRSVNFTRMQPLTVVTSPLAEMSNPVVCALNLCTVTMTLSEFGMTTYTSRFASTISIDANMKEQIAVVGQNMGETLNKLVGEELQNGSSYYGNNHAVNNLAAGDTIDACDIRMLVQTMELNRAQKYPDGMFVAKTGPYSKANLLADTTWVAAHTYTDTKELYKGEMGELYGVRFLLNPLVFSGTEATSTAASTVVRFYTFIHGANAFGCYDLEKDQPKLYLLPNATDSNSPAGRLSVISWAGVYATKVLNSDWVISCRFTSA